MRNILILLGLASLLISACGPMPGRGTIRNQDVGQLNLSNHMIVQYPNGKRLLSIRQQRRFNKWLGGKQIAGTPHYPNALFIRYKPNGKIGFWRSYRSHTSGRHRAILTQDKDNNNDDWDSVEERCEHFKTYKCELYAIAIRKVDFGR